MVKALTRSRRRYPASQYGQNHITNKRLFVTKKSSRFLCLRGTVVWAPCILYDLSASRVQGDQNLDGPHTTVTKIQEIVATATAFRCNLQGIPRPDPNPASLPSPDYLAQRCIVASTTTCWRIYRYTDWATNRLGMAIAIAELRSCVSPHFWDILGLWGNRCTATQAFPQKRSHKATPQP